MQPQLRLGQEGVDEGFVGAAGRFDQAYRRLVDLLYGLVRRLLFAAHQWNFAVDIQGGAEEGFFLALQRDRDPADRDVAFARQHVGHQGFPGGLHPLDLDAEAVGQRAGHGDVDSRVFAVIGLGGIRFVVARGTDAQLALLDDGVQVRWALCCLSAGG
ncbi:hypothetical protein D3C86_1444460 [compost metagenome]